jgi:hypothetical protein
MLSCLFWRIDSKCIIPLLQDGSLDVKANRNCMHGETEFTHKLIIVCFIVKKTCQKCYIKHVLSHLVFEVHVTIVWDNTSQQCYLTL